MRKLSLSFDPKTRLIGAAKKTPTATAHASRLLIWLRRVACVFRFAGDQCFCEPPGSCRFWENRIGFGTAWKLAKILHPDPAAPLMANGPADSCGHRHVDGDNYGQTCRDCGEVLAGMGYGGQFPGARPGQTCVHRFWLSDQSDESGQYWETCLYCEHTRPNPNKLV